jgi:dodecin
MSVSVAKITEICASSEKGFDHAVEKGIARASKTLKNVTGAWVKDMKVDVDDGKVVRWRVTMKVTFVLDE